MRVRGRRWPPAAALVPNCRNLHVPDAGRKPGHQRDINRVAFESLAGLEPWAVQPRRDIFLVASVIELGGRYMGSLVAEKYTTKKIGDPTCLMRCAQNCTYPSDGLAPRFAPGQSRRSGDVCRWSAYPSTAVELMRTAIRRNVPGAEVADLVGSLWARASRGSRKVESLSTSTSLYACAS